MTPLEKALAKYPDVLKLYAKALPIMGAWLERNGFRCGKVAPYRRTELKVLLKGQGDKLALYVWRSPGSYAYLDVGDREHQLDVDSCAAVILPEGTFYEDLLGYLLGEGVQYVQLERLTEVCAYERTGHRSSE